MFLACHFFFLYISRFVSFCFYTGIGDDNECDDGGGGDGGGGTSNEGGNGGNGERDPFNTQEEQTEKNK